MNTCQSDTKNVTRELVYDRVKIKVKRAKGKGVRYRSLNWYGSHIPTLYIQRERQRERRTSTTTKNLGDYERLTTVTKLRFRQSRITLRSLFLWAWLYVRWGHWAYWSFALFCGASLKILPQARGLVPQSSNVECLRERAFFFFVLHTDRGETVSSSSRSM